MYRVVRIREKSQGEVTEWSVQENNVYTFMTDFCLCGTGRATIEYSVTGNMDDNCDKGIVTHQLLIILQRGIYASQCLSTDEERMKNGIKRIKTGVLRY